MPVRKIRTIRSGGTATVCLVLLLVLFYALFKNLLLVHAAYPATPTTLFMDTTPATFTIGTIGSGGRIAYSVTDFGGATLASGSAAVSARQAGITLPRLPDGYYVLHINDNSAQSAPAQTISFAVLAPFTPDPHSPFGVGVHFNGGNNPALSGLISAMGAGMVRDDATWSQIERSPGQYTFDGYDSYMQVLQQQNLSPLLILDYNNRFYDQGHTPYDDAGLRAFANYAKAVVMHYGSQLKAVEVYNEYNGIFSNGPCARKPECYAQMLRYTYQAIKAVRPDLTVVGGVAFFADQSWFEKLFKAGGLRYMDAVSDHPYTTMNMASPEIQGTARDMNNLETLIKRYNGGVAKPLWITEIGWPTSYLHPSERGQADYLVRSSILSLATGVQKIFWYDFLNDGVDPSKSEQNFGLLRRPDAAGRYTPKPAYVAYAVMARELAGRAYVASESIGWGNHDVRFSGNLRVFWTTLIHQNVALTTNVPVTVTSLTGRAEVYRPSGGRVVLTLSADPVYVQGAISGVNWLGPF